MIGYVASDLVWASRIKAEADAKGLSSRRVTSVDRLREVLLTDAEALILIDLESEDADVIIDALRGAGAIEGAASARTVAWGPHVMTDRLQEAKDRGVDVVLPRGAFAARLPTLLGESAG